MLPSPHRAGKATAARASRGSAGARSLSQGCRRQQALSQQFFDYAPAAATISEHVCTNQDEHY